MAGRMRALSEYATTVVRLFPDCAESVIWFQGPVPYEESRLDARLITDLRAWDASYSAGLSDDEWRSRDLKRSFDAEGARLALRVADELGADFQVEYDRGRSHRRARATGPAQNPDAWAAFRRMADAARAEWERLRQVVDQAARDGHTLEWRAY